jgi:hypothetical protein
MPFDTVIRQYAIGFDPWPLVDITDDSKILGVKYKQKNTPKRINTQSINLSVRLLSVWISFQDLPSITY